MVFGGQEPTSIDQVGAVVEKTQLLKPEGSPNLRGLEAGNSVSGRSPRPSGSQHPRLGWCLPSPSLCVPGHCSLSNKPLPYSWSLCISSPPNPAVLTPDLAALEPASRRPLDTGFPLLISPLYPRRAPVVAEAGFVNTASSLGVGNQVGAAERRGCGRDEHRPTCPSVGTYGSSCPARLPLGEVCTGQSPLYPAPVSHAECV